MPVLIIKQDPIGCKCQNTGFALSPCPQCFSSLGSDSNHAAALLRLYNNHLATTETSVPKGQAPRETT